MSIGYYFDQIIRRRDVAKFQRVICGILSTPPVNIASGGPIVLSMVHHRDVLPYLLAIKSFAQHFPPGSVVVVADPSITNADRKVLCSHVPGIQLRDACEFQAEGIPVGGTWERLSAISAYVAQGFVIQLDADTITLGSVRHVKQAFSTNRSFTLGTSDLQSMVGVEEVERWAKNICSMSANPHIQLKCEALVFEGASQGNSASLYTRGCSGFTGFGQGSISPADVKALSMRMSGALGDSWREWGTEQFSSNYLIANVPGSLVLPHPVYTTPDRIDGSTEFVHFIGPKRYLRGIYASLALNFIEGGGALEVHSADC